MTKMHTENNLLVPMFVLLLIMVGQSAVDTYLPSLPAIVDDLLTSESKIQLTLTTFFIGIALSQLIYGPLSEVFGRRPVLLFGLVVFVIGSFTCANATQVEWLLAGRLIQGTGAGAASLLSRVIMRDSFEGTQLTRLASYALMAWACVPMLAPLMGGYLQEYINWRASFVVLGVFGVILLALIYSLLPETRDLKHSSHPERRTVFTSYKTLLTSKVFMGYTLCVSTIFGVFVAFNAIGPFLLQEKLNLSAINYSWIVAIIGFGFLMGSYINSKITEKYNQDKLVLGGFMLFYTGAISMLLFALGGILNLYAIAIPLFIVQTSLGFIVPNCMAGCMQPFPHIAGSAGAIFGCLFLSVGAITSSIVSSIADGGHIPLALTILILGIISSSVFALLILKPTRHKKKPTFV